MPSIAAALLGLAACGSPSDDAPELGEYRPDGVDVSREIPTDAEPVEATAGDVCLYANHLPEAAVPTDETRLLPGDLLVAEVSLPSCLSESCDVKRHARCDVTRDGDVLIVTADFEYVEVDDGFCTLDCELLTATCEAGPLEAGTYVIEHAGQSEELTIPSTIDSCPIEPQYCERTEDCDRGFCGQSLAGNGICREYSQRGEACGGYGAPGTAGVGLCAPGLVCDDEGLAVDLPGTCVIDARQSQPDRDMSMNQPGS